MATGRSRPVGDPEDSLTDVRGVEVGRAETPGGRSGVTTVLFDAARPTVVDVRGGASCTYDTSSLALEATFGRRWAIFLAGGSVYGLDAGRGVRTRVIERGGGHSAFRNPNVVAPITGATLFDLPRTVGPVPDYLPVGYAAARGAARAPVRSGRFGGGAGATVGKYLGRGRSMPGGEGSASERVRGLGTVGVLADVNAIGAVRDPGDGRWLAGARDPTGSIVPPDRAAERPAGIAGERGTTLCVGVIEAAVERRVLQRLAGQVHLSLARTIYPAHTALDGDVVFVASTEARSVPATEPRPGATADLLGLAIGRCTERAIARAVSGRPDGPVPRRRRDGAAARPAGPG